MIRSFHYELGQKGEATAREYLLERGYQILETNYKCEYGEIDIIAVQKKTLCFIEIKARSSTYYGAPAEAVGKRKQQRLIRSAEWYLSTTSKKYAECRFDVMEMLYDRDSESFRDITLIRDAFEVE